jgi:hypothetical protein
VSENSLRDELLRRLEDLMARRQRLLAAIGDARRDLELTGERIEAAARLYELEFGTRPPQLGALHAEDVLGAPEPIPRRARVGTNWAHEIAHVLAEAAEPLHVQAIWEQLQERGFRTNSSDPLRAIVATASRRSDLLVRAAPNTYGLNGADAAATGRVPIGLFTTDAQSTSLQRAEAMGDEELDLAARMIRDNGAPPLIAIPDPTIDGHYRVIDGLRRLLAARRAGLEALPAEIIATGETSTSHAGTDRPQRTTDHDQRQEGASHDRIN